MICPHCKKEINRKDKIIELLKTKTYSVNQLSNELLISPASTLSHLNHLEKENKIIVTRCGRGKKAIISLNDKQISQENQIITRENKLESNLLP